MALFLLPSEAINHQIHTATIQCQSRVKLSEQINLSYRYLCVHLPDTCGSEYVWNRALMNPTLSTRHPLSPGLRHFCSDNSIAMLIRSVWGAGASVIILSLKGRSVFHGSRADGKSVSASSTRLFSTDISAIRLCVSARCS